ncbi:MAG TPA: hypothetical protein VF606_09995, partial [Geminicoccaceae bacterium]
MAHFAFLAPPLTGHYKPLAALAHALVARGHRATFVHQSGAAPLAASLGVNFVALPEGQGGSVGGWTGAMARTLGLSGIGGTIGAMARQTELLCREAPDVLREIGADAVIADQLEAAGGLVADHLRLPFVTV